MKNISDRWLAELLLLEGVLEEVCEKFGEAMADIDEVSSRVMVDYFDGQTPKQIAIKSGLSENEIVKLIEQSKRKLIEHLRRACHVRQ